MKNITPPSSPAAGYAANNYRPSTRDEHVVASIAMGPLRAAQRGYRHLSSVAGFGIIASLMTCYCAALSIETVMIAVPGAMNPDEYTEQLKRSKRFVPKPYVNDGAELGRLSPLPNLRRAFLERYFSWLPMWIRSGGQAPYWTVWDEPVKLLLAIVIAVTIQRFEGMIWRKKSAAATKAEFDAANAQRIVEADPRAIALARYKAAQHNTQGTGSVVGTFVAVVLLYGLEIGAFIGSFAGAGNWAVNAVYGLLTIAGFEVFDRMADDAPEG